MPPPGAASTRQVPPISAARSRIEDSPTPGDQVGRQPASVVGDLDGERLRRPRPAARRRCRAPAWRTTLVSASCTIAVGGHLDRRRQRRQLAPGRRRATREPVGADALGQPLQRADQAELVQRRRPQPVDQPADVGDRRAQLAAQLAGQRLGRRRVAGDQAAQHAGLHGQPGQLRAEPVVQVAAQPPPLLLAGGDQPLAGALQVGGEPRRRTPRRRPGGRGRRAAAGRRGRTPSSPGRRPEHQVADRRAVVEQRQRTVGRGTGSPDATASARRRRARSRRTAAAAPPARSMTIAGRTASGASVPSSRSPSRESAA